MGAGDHTVNRLHVGHNELPRNTVHASLRLKAFMKIETTRGSRKSKGHRMTRFMTLQWCPESAQVLELEAEPEASTLSPLLRVKVHNLPAMRWFGRHEDKRA